MLQRRLLFGDEILVLVLLSIQNYAVDVIGATIATEKPLTQSSMVLEKISDDSSGHHPGYNYSRRNLTYLPPPPITPFRGGLRTVHQNRFDINPENSSSDPSNDDSYLSSTSQYSSVSAWSPEQYPDPWTNPFACGGAATANLRSDEERNQTQRQTNTTMIFHAATDRDFMRWFDIPALGNEEHMMTESEEDQFKHKRKLLFCDPDQVLDKETLRAVGMKLQTFADTFASSAPYIEGGNFGEPSDISLDNSDETSTVQADENSNGTGTLSLLLNSIKTLLHIKDERAPFPERNNSQLLKGSPELDPSSNLGTWQEGMFNEPLEVGIALVKKIDLPAILRADSYFFYSDQDDMINDAAQYFARYIHDTWFRHLMMQEQRISSPTNIVLIFISTDDKICYISSGTRISAVLPWWRLEHVVQDMKPNLRKGQTGDALGIAIDNLTELLQRGPPSLLDRLDDFVRRFGIVIAFTIFTFVFASWGECRDRRKRIFFAERRSRLTTAEKNRASQLQQEFKTKMCPICLEPFETENSPSKKLKRVLKRVDSFGIPLRGTDDKPIKILRCGHIFDETCWKMWVDTGQGNPWLCPVCRQDVGRVKQRTGVNLRDPERADEREVGSNRGEPESRIVSLRIPPATPNMLLLPVGHTHPSYSSLLSWAPLFGDGVPFAPFSHPPIRRLRPWTGANANNDGALVEETPLIEQNVLTSDDNDDY